MRQDLRRLRKKLANKKDLITSISPAPIVFTGPNGEYCGEALGRDLVDGTVGPRKDTHVIDLSFRAKPLFEGCKRVFNTLFGGRSGRKTRDVAQMLVEWARLQYHFIVCAREIMKSLDDSSHKALSDEIRRRGLEGSEFRILQNEIRHNVTGSKFVYKGMSASAGSNKGIEGATICWVEEAENVSAHSWRELIPTILRTDGAFFIVTFNTRYEDDPTYEKFVKDFELDNGFYADDRYLVSKYTYKENHYLNKAMRDEAAELEMNDPELHRWIWLGEIKTISKERVIFDKCIVKEFSPPSYQDKFGIDFGFNDPTAITRSFYHDNSLYIYEEWGGPSIDIDKLRALLDRIDEKRIEYFNCDPADKTTIKTLNNNWTDENGEVKKGFACFPAKKPAGSVHAGIRWLRSLKAIYIHPRCVQTIEESKKWRWKVHKRTGEVLEELAEGNDHRFDSVRYAHYQTILSSGVATV